MKKRENKYSDKGFRHEDFVVHILAKPDSSHIYFPVVIKDPNYNKELNEKYLKYKESEVVYDKDFIS
ncbi:MAG: hypothetical protein HGGPFJEG_01201 [Ignavibacteria bacterium]|nr:hypothetical protein [Ignavibacteria bacterium]